MPEFILNTEGINSRGGRILTNGLLLDRFSRNPVMLYNHDAGDGWQEDEKASEKVIGKWIDLRIEGDRLIGTPEFAEGNDRAESIKKKVEQGIINATSLGLRVLDHSYDPENMIFGQTDATITKAEILEISLVAIPSNPETTRLAWNKSDKYLAFSFNNQLKPNGEQSMKVVLEKLNLKEGATESQVLNAINQMDEDKKRVERELGEAKQTIQKMQADAQNAECTRLLDDAIRQGKITESDREAYSALYEKDPKGTEAKLAAKKPYKSPMDEIKAPDKGEGKRVSFNQKWLEYCRKNGDTTIQVFMANWVAEDPVNAQEAYKKEFGKEFQSN